jgi:resuscitation-promoting factor RpfB
VIAISGTLLIHKTVTLRVDGKGQRVDTFALTVGGLLQMERIPIGPADSLSPGGNHWLLRGETIIVEHAVPVLISADGKAYSLLTVERRPLELLAQGGVTLQPGDVLLSAGLPISPGDPLPRAPILDLQIRRAVTFTLQTDAGVIETYRSAAATVSEALWQSGITLYAADRLQPDPEAPLTAGLAVRLQRARPVTIHTADGEVHTRSAAGTVGEVLAEAHLSPQGLDYSQPAVDAPLPADGSIRLIRVQESVLIEEMPLPFKTETQAVATLELDSQTVVQPGVEGITARRVRVRSEDGVEVARWVEGEWVARQPQPRIIGYGSKIVMHTLDTPDGQIQYWRALQFWVTSYHPSEGGSITASGKPVSKGLVGVDTSYIPFGTMMYVPGYGFAEAADTGRISGRWLDLGYSDDEYVPWHQWVTVYFLWPPPGFVPLTIPPPSNY